jgi:hypothetical protein
MPVTTASPASLVYRWLRKMSTKGPILTDSVNTGVEVARILLRWEIRAKAWKGRDLVFSHESKA